MDKFKEFALVIVIVFIGACGAQFLLNVTDVFHTEVSTWQNIVNAGVIAVVTYVVAWLVPMVKQFGIGSK